MTSAAGTSGTSRDKFYLSPCRDGRDKRDTPLRGCVSRCPGPVSRLRKGASNEGESGVGEKARPSATDNIFIRRPKWPR